MRGADGVLRQVHSQWVVKNGADGKPERVLGIVVDDTEAWRLAQSVHETNAQLGLALELATSSSSATTWRPIACTTTTRPSRSLGMTPRRRG